MPWLLVLLACAFSVIIAISYGSLKLRVSFADDQIRIFDEMKVSSNTTSDPHRLTGFLAYAVNYYPSGSKQTTGTRLDRIVETGRSNAIAEIVIRLQNITGKSLGSDPQKWIAEYPPLN